MICVDCSFGNRLMNIAIKGCGKMTDNEVMNQFRENLNKSIKILAQSLRDNMAPALERLDGRTEMKTYEIKVCTHEEWETPDGNLCTSDVKSERAINVDSFKDAFNYVNEKFNAENVTITSLKIKDIIY